MSRKTTIFALAGILVVASTGTFVTLLTAPAAAVATPTPCDETHPCDLPSETSPIVDDACEDCDETPPATASGSGVSGGAASGAPPVHPCQTIDLQAAALDNGHIRLTWVLPDGARGVILLRDGIQIAGLAQPAEAFLDETTTNGETYTYRLEVYFPNDAADQPTHECRAEVTAVPVFGSVVAGSLAVGLGLLAYVGVRRRP